MIDSYGGLWSHGAHDSGVGVATKSRENSQHWRLLMDVKQG